MEDEKVVPTVQELAGFDLNDPTIIELIHQAQESDAADRQLTIKQALKKYKKAALWAMLLSTSLIMEGYDLVIVRGISSFIQCWDDVQYSKLILFHRSPLSTVKHNFRIDSESTMRPRGTTSSLHHGSLACPTPLSWASWLDSSSTRTLKIDWAVGRR
jgi:hypothetical protein